MAIEMKEPFWRQGKVLFTGVSYGDCRPPTLQCPVSDNTARLVQLADHLGANEVFIPTPELLTVLLVLTTMACTCLARELFGLETRRMRW